MATPAQNSASKFDCNSVIKYFEGQKYSFEGVCDIHHTDTLTFKYPLGKIQCPYCKNQHIGNNNVGINVKVYNCRNSVMIQCDNYEPVVICAGSIVFDNYVSTLSMRVQPVHKVPTLYTSDMTPKCPPPPYESTLQIAKDIPVILNFKYNNYDGGYIQYTDTAIFFNSNIPTISQLKNMSDYFSPNIPGFSKRTSKLNKSELIARAISICKYWQSH